MSKKPARKSAKKKTKKKAEAKSHLERFRAGEIGKDTRWRPGVSGNPGGLPGRPKTKTLTDLASEMIEEKANDPKEREKLKAALWKMCLSDKVAASMTLRLLWERLEGKVKEEIDLNVTNSMRETVQRARERAQAALEAPKTSTTGLVNGSPVIG